MSDDRLSGSPEGVGDHPYRVPTTPVEARIVLAGGATLDVVVFLAPVSGRHPGPETLDEFLNSERPFIPVRTRDSDQSMLVNRHQVLYVEVSAGAPSALRREEHLAASVDLVRVELESGAAVEGTLRILSPASSRTSDYFNGRERFFPVEVGERIVYVNKQRVRLVTF